MHALQTIAETGSKPMTKAPIRIESRDDRLAGEMLAAEVMAESKGRDNVWLAFAKRVTSMTVEARKVFINAIKSEKAAMTKAQSEHGFDAKFAKKQTGTFTTQSSRLQTIANAWNSGASVEGFREFMLAQGADKSITADAAWEHAGYTSIYAYAQTFSQSNAGRRPDPLLVKLGKFIDAQRKAGVADADLPLMDELVEFFNSKAV